MEDSTISTKEIYLKEQLKSILTEETHVDKISKLKLKAFLKEDFDDDTDHLRRKAKKVLNLMKESKKQKKLTKEYMRIANQAGLLRGKMITDLNRETDNRNGLMIDVDDCYTVNILSHRIEEEFYRESTVGDGTHQTAIFSTKEDAEKYVDFLKKIVPGTRFKCKNLGNWNDGTYNEDAKAFYGISDREEVYSFDKDKIWTIKAVGYFEQALVIPFTESECTDSKGNKVTDWQLPRFMYNNIEFI